MTRSYILEIGVGMALLSQSVHSTDVADTTADDVVCLGSELATKSVEDKKACTVVTGDLNALDASQEFTNLRLIEGDLNISRVGGYVNERTIKFPNLQMVTGKVIIKYNPNLTELDLSKLKTINGDSATNSKDASLCVEGNLELSEIKLSSLYTVNAPAAKDWRIYMGWNSKLHTVDLGSLRNISKCEISMHKVPQNKTQGVHFHPDPLAFAVVAGMRGPDVQNVLHLSSKRKTKNFMGSRFEFKRPSQPCEQRRQRVGFLGMNEACLGNIYGILSGDDK